jgi:hypothetical protein
MVRKGEGREWILVDISTGLKYNGIGIGSYEVTVRFDIQLIC